MAGEPKSVEIAIVGAGVIGLSIALRLASSGREVALIDPSPPGSGASFGNAGTFADYACVPVGNPDVLKNLPKLLLDFKQSVFTALGSAFSTRAVACAVCAAVAS